MKAKTWCALRIILLQHPTTFSPPKFATVFQHHASLSQLANACKTLVNNIRKCVKEVLVLLFRVEKVTNIRPELQLYLSARLDQFLDKRLAKAEEVVAYLSKAELTKRDTRDETYERIKTKVGQLAEKAHSNTEKNRVYSPPEQVVAKGTDPDVIDIPDGFIMSYYSRAIEQGRDELDANIADLQVRVGRSVIVSRL